MSKGNGLSFDVSIEGEMFYALQKQLSDYRKPELLKLASSLKQILKQAHEQRFDLQQGLNGAAWEPDSLKTTVPMKGHSTILHWTGDLRGSVQVETQGDDEDMTLLVETDSPYATTMQYGAKKREFGVMANGIPIPWGDIPPRHWFGADDALYESLAETIRQHFYRKWKAKKT